jgi:hypothetical protein
MAEKDGDTWYCFYAVMKLRWKPSEFAFLPPQERALMYAFIDEMLREEEKQQRKLKSRRGKWRGGHR